MLLVTPLLDFVIIIVVVMVVLDDFGSCDLGSCCEEIAEVGWLPPRDAPSRVCHFQLFWWQGWLQAWFRSIGAGWSVDTVYWNLCQDRCEVFREKGSFSQRFGGCMPDLSGGGYLVLGGGWFGPGELVARWRSLLASSCVPAWRVASFLFVPLSLISFLRSLWLLGGAVRRSNGYDF